MAINEPRNWLIAYDIADPRRLARVHRFLKSRAVPVQYSVFVAQLTPMKVGMLKSDLAGLLDHKEDDVRIYPIPEPADLKVLGRKAFPEGLNVIDSRLRLPLGLLPLKDENHGITIEK